MEQCRLGYNHLHVVPSPPEDQLPPDYVVVKYSCPCGEFRTQFALHLLLLCHLMGTQGMNMGGPEARQYLRMLSNLQQEALDAIRNEMNEVEVSPDR